MEIQEIIREIRDAKADLRVAFKRYCRLLRQTSKIPFEDIQIARDRMTAGLTEMFIEVANECRQGM